MREGMRGLRSASGSGAGGWYSMPSGSSSYPFHMSLSVGNSSRRRRACSQATQHQGQM